MIISRAKSDDFFGFIHFISSLADIILEPIFFSKFAKIEPPVIMHENNNEFVERINNVHETYKCGVNIILSIWNANTAKKEEAKCNYDLSRRENIPRFLFIYR